MLILTRASPISRGGAPLNIDYRTANTSNATASSYTFSSQDIGAASPDRYVLVAVYSGSTVGSFTFSSLTVGGISATELTSQLGSVSGAWSRTGFFLAAVSTGTTANIVVAMSNNQVQCRIGVWALTNLVSATPVDTAGSTSLTATLDMDTVAGGGAFVAGRTNLSGTFTPPSGFTEHYDNVNSTVGFAVASLATTSAESPRSISLSISAGSLPVSAGVSLR